MLVLFSIATTWYRLVKAEDETVGYKLVLCLHFNSFIKLNLLS